MKTVSLDTAGGYGDDNKYAEMMADFLCVNKTLEILLLNYFDCTDEGAKAFAASLKKNKTLQVLSLTQNSIGDDGAKAIAEALTENETLQRQNWR